MKNFVGQPGPEKRSSHCHVIWHSCQVVGFWHLGNSWDIASHPTIPSSHLRALLPLCISLLGLIIGPLAQPLVCSTHCPDKVPWWDICLNEIVLVWPMTSDDVPCTKVFYKGFQTS